MKLIISLIEDGRLNFEMSAGHDKAHWLINMGLHETALIVLWSRLYWRSFILKNFDLGIKNWRKNC